MKVYRVGGAVRDRLLGIPHADSDWVVVGATPQQLVALGYRAVGKDFPVFLHPQTHEEYALARTERKVAPGYKGFTFHAAPDVTLEDDLRRRDLTINAIAEAEDGTIIDPFGGRRDLEQRLLRHVSTAFSEDPVRILRVARFAARFHKLGFRVAPETESLMREMVQAGEVDALVPERVWQETVRALGEETPSIFFTSLRPSGALAKLFPEIERLFGVPQRPEYHPEIDCGVHTMMVVDRAAQISADTRVRFAALVHDLGKGTTPQELLPRHHGHEHRSVDLVEDLCRRIRIPNEYRELAAMVARYHGACHTFFELKASTVVKTLRHLDAFRRPERLGQFLLACQADAQGRLNKTNEPYPQAPAFEQCFQAARAVDVKALVAQGLRGAALGQKLHRARIAAVAGVLSAIKSRASSTA